MAVTGLRAFFQDQKRNPKRSYNLILEERENKPTYWQRLAGVYRIYSGRLNSPKTTRKTIVDGAETLTESPSRNHAGVYDYLTGGVLNAIESFASGNWIQTPARRTAWKIFLSPVWVPLNLVRAAFSLIATLLSTVPMIGVHNSQIKKQKAADLAAQQLAQEQANAKVEANKLELGQQIDMTPAAPAPEQPKPALNKRVSTTLSQIAPRKSRDALNEKTFDKTQGGAPLAFRAELLATPVESANAYWKVTETSKEITARLVEGKAKHPERYSNVAVALPKGIKKAEANGLIQRRISDTIGALPKDFATATVNTNGDTLAAETSASKKEGKPLSGLGKKIRGKKKAGEQDQPKPASRFNLFNRTNKNPEAKTPSKTVSAIIPSFGR